MKTTIFRKKDDTELNLSKAYFWLVDTIQDGLLVYSIIFDKVSKNPSIGYIYSYEEMKNLETNFIVKGDKGWTTYKTFKGVMTRLHNDLYNFKKTKL